MSNLRLGERQWLEIRGEFERLLKMVQNLPMAAGFEIRLGRQGPGHGIRNGPHVTAFGHETVLIECLVQGQAERIQAGLRLYEARLGTFQFRSGSGSYVAPAPLEGEG